MKFSNILAGIISSFVLINATLINSQLLITAGIDASPFIIVYITILSSVLMAKVSQTPIFVSISTLSTSFFVHNTLSALHPKSGLFVFFIVSMINIISTVTGIRLKLIHAIPQLLTQLFTFTVGLFLMLTALLHSGILTFQSIGPVYTVLFTKEHLLYLIWFIAMLLYRLFNKHISPLLILIITAIVYRHFINPDHWIPSTDFQIQLFQWDPSQLFSVSFIKACLSLSIVTLIDGSLAIKSLITEFNRVSNQEQTITPPILLVDGASSCLSSVFGLSSFTYYFDSLLPISMHATSTSTYVIACCLTPLLYFSKYFVWIPHNSLGMVLFFVGWNIVQQSFKILPRSYLIIITITLLISKMDITKVFYIALYLQLYHSKKMNQPTKGILISIIFLTLFFYIK